MRVLQFVADGAPGGGTTHVRQLLDRLPCEFETGLLTQVDSHLHGVGCTSGIRTFGGDFFRGRLSRVDPRCIGAVRDAIRTFQPDLIHCHGGRAAFFRGCLSDRTPTVYTAHGLHYSRKPNSVLRALGRFGERWGCRHLSHAIYVCEHDANLARTDGLLSTDTPSSVIYPSIAPHALDRVPSNGGPPVVGFVGRMVEQKNPRLFLDVIEQLPGVRAIMGGGGPLLNELAAESAKRGLADRITMAGELSHREVLELLCGLDVLVMTSLWEGLPALLLEAMYLGVPVVSTAVGGISEIIQQGQTGFLSQRADGQELASHVRRLLDDPNERERIINTARDQVRSRFLETTMVEAVANIYRAVLREGIPAERAPMSLVPTL